MRKHFQILSIGLVISIALSSLGFAQVHNGLELTAKCDGVVQAYPTLDSKDEVLLWNNVDNTGSTNGIISTHLGALNPGLVETADDFVL